MRPPFGDVPDGEFTRQITAFAGLAADHIDHMTLLQGISQIPDSSDLRSYPHPSRYQSENPVSPFSKDYRFEVVDGAFQPRGRDREGCAIIDADEYCLLDVFLPRRRKGKRLAIDIGRFFRDMPAKRVQNPKKERFHDPASFDLIFFAF